MSWIKKTYLSLSELQSLVRSAGISSAKEYFVWQQVNKQLIAAPSRPDQNNYSDWTTWKDFLDTDNVWSKAERDYFTYEEAKSYIQTIKFTSLQAFRSWNQNSDTRHPKLPRHPNSHYKSSFEGWRTFLGNGQSKRHRIGIDFLSYNDARILMETLKIAVEPQFKSLMQSNARPLNVPTNPDKHYADWISYGHFLDLGRKVAINDGLRKPYQRDKISFAELRDEVRKLATCHRQDYLNFAKKNNFPRTPQNTYRRKWQGWEDFLGQPLPQAVPGKSFEESKRVLRECGLPNSTSCDYRRARKVLGLHWNPRKHFADSWLGWDDFLGRTMQGRQAVTFDDLRDVVQSINVEDCDQYMQLCKELHWPNDPASTFKTYWNGWNHFLWNRI
jgi:hypothetical protein